MNPEAVCSVCVSLTTYVARLATSGADGMACTPGGIVSPAAASELLVGVLQAHIHTVVSCVLGLQVFDACNMWHTACNVCMHKHQQQQHCLLKVCEVPTLAAAASRSTFCLCAPVSMCGGVVRACVSVSVFHCVLGCMLGFQ